MKRRTLMTVLAASPLAGCVPAQRDLVLAGTTMGTSYSVKLSPPADGTPLSELHATVEHTLAEVVRAMSHYDPHSELSQFNHHRSTRWMPVSPALFTVLDSALRISALSHGAFDVTLGPLLDLWGFGPALRERHVPSPDAIAKAAAAVGYRHVRLDPRARAIGKLRPDTQLDLSSIAKGHGVDRVAQLLDSKGVANYLVDIGGDMRSRGLATDRESWRIGVQAPTLERRHTARTIRVGDHGIATSGNYQDYFARDGQHYSHLLRPDTARPVSHPLTSVTVVAGSAMEADALATALLVMGPGEGYRLAQTEGLAALFIVAEADGFRTASSDAFAPFVLN